jgi:hypothetical protein
MDALVRCRLASDLRLGVAFFSNPLIFFSGGITVLAAGWETLCLRSGRRNVLLLVA